jgi:hypothetical protein
MIEPALLLPYVYDCCCRMCIYHCRHLRGGQLSTVPMRPALLVCGPGSTGVRGGPTSRRDRDSTLLAALREVRGRGRGWRDMGVVLCSHSLPMHVVCGRQQVRCALLAAPRDV